MGVKEEEIPGGWQRTFTGEDIPKAKGSLEKTAKEAYRKAFHRDEGKFVRISDPSGRETAVRHDQLDAAIAAGYGRFAISPRMTMPAVPWKRRRVSPGKHKYRYDKLTGQMVEV